MNGCRQNESPISWYKWSTSNLPNTSPSCEVKSCVSNNQIHQDISSSNWNTKSPLKCLNEKYAQIKHYLQINVDRFWCERATGDAMYWRKRYYGQLKVKTYYLQTLSFSRNRLNYLWCFYQLLSFWRHPFTSEDPLVSKWCDAKCLQFCSNEETNSILNGRRVSTANFHFVNYSFKVKAACF